MEIYVAPVRESLLMSPKKFFRTRQPREDYREFLERIILFLGELPEQDALVIRKTGSFPKSTLDKQGPLFGQDLDIPGTNRADSRATKRPCKS